ncbi:hypothetical protein VVR12_07345 [Rothia sp. LK2588]|uniref:hypothetical protein n=1 Tax=Rothia sp. LK2588 TaxID=3114369 RepID=UPI0034CE57AA
MKKIFTRGSSVLIVLFAVVMIAGFKLLAAGSIPHILALIAVSVAFFGIAAIVVHSARKNSGRTLPDHRS